MYLAQVTKCWQWDAAGVASVRRTMEDSHQKILIFPEGLQRVGRTHSEAGEKYEEEGAAETNSYGLTTTLHSP